MTVTFPGEMVPDGCNIEKCKFRCTRSESVEGEDEETRPAFVVRFLMNENHRAGVSTAFLDD